MRKLKICNDSCCLFYIPYQNTIDLELIWSLSLLKLYQTNSLISAQYLFPLFIALWFSLYVCIIETHSVCWYHCFHRSANIKYLASKTFMCHCNGKTGRSKNSIVEAWLSFIQYVKKSFMIFSNGKLNHFTGSISKLSDTRFIWWYVKAFLIWYEMLASLHVPLMRNGFHLALPNIRHRFALSSITVLNMYASLVFCHYL